MSHDTFPAPNNNPSPESGKRPIIVSEPPELSPEVLQELLLTARANGLDFVYRPKRESSASRGIMLVAEGVAQNHVVRVMLDEHEYHE